MHKDPENVTMRGLPPFPPMSFTDPKLTQLDFHLGVLRLLYAFHTETSLSLSVQSDASQFARGWVDIHYPCNGSTKLQIRGTLADVDLNTETVREIIGNLLTLLGIPKNETYEAVFFKASRQIQMTQSNDNESMTDRLETTRRFTLSEE
jgi:hypothetical protein